MHNSMELSKNYTPSTVEQKWYSHWQAQGYFTSTVDHTKPAYTVVIPPPNVTGVLHMGHTLNETVQDILIRRARMTGHNACWVPGSDHASIATEAKVVQMLKEKGIEKNDLTRAEFLKYAFEWKEKYGNIIYDQIKKLGCSVDWDRVSFTMDKHYYDAVLRTFVDLYNKGLIYRGARMINWDVAAQTALSDEEVEFKDVEGKLYYIKYVIAPDDDVVNEANAIKWGTNEQPYITIATQRPETIMGDTAVCFNPTDERYTWLKGKKVIVPLINKAVPVIYDSYVDATFGTGCLKVTPAHDINDYNIGLRHQLEVIDTLNSDGTISEAGVIHVGVDRFKARKLIVAQLAQQGLLVKEEAYPTRMGYSQRTGVVVEPKISTQWFLKMTNLAAPALEAVTSGHIKIHPGDRFLATYKHWLENVKDWCISRQLWWGQQIPAWYDAQGNMVVATTIEEAKLEMQKITTQDIATITLTQDADVLDTWFSSWLWPIEVFKGITNPNNEEINYYYPTATLVTGQDIIFFWVARMVMAGMEYRNQIPFNDVYFTGMVRDKQGRKMSKSLGNSPDLLELIAQYGADAVRFGIMISSPAGNDLLFDEGSLEQGKFFNNKLWNALKLIKMWEANQSNTINTENDFAISWFSNRLAITQSQVTTLLKEFKLNEALKTIYSLIWDDYCSWYLEWIKPNYGEAIPTHVYTATVLYYEQLMVLLHPFMPFITEELYHQVSTRTPGDDVCIYQIPTPATANELILEKGNLLQQYITAIRDVRNKQQLKPKDTIQVYLDAQDYASFNHITQVLAKQVNAANIQPNTEPVHNAITLVIGTHTVYVTSDSIVPVNDATQIIALEKELQHLQGFLQGVLKKLSNEKFVANAKPEVLATEQQKQADALDKINKIEAILQGMQADS